MILVSVGSDAQPFDRLMRWLDLLVAKGLIEEILEVQYGACQVHPRQARLHRQLAAADFRRLARQARVVIAHCDEAAIQALETLQVPFLLVPRSARFGEHVDDHQLELASALEAWEVPIAWCPADLVRFLAAPRSVNLGDRSGSSSAALAASLLRRFPPPSPAGDPQR